MDDLVGTVAVFLLAATPFAAILTGYAVLRNHRGTEGSHPVWRGVGVAMGLAFAVPVTFLLVGHSAGRSWAHGLLYLGPLVLLGIGVYVLAGGRYPDIIELRNAKKR